MVVTIEQNIDGSWNRVYRNPSKVTIGAFNICHRVICDMNGYRLDKDNNPIIPLSEGGPHRKNKTYVRISPYKRGHKMKKHTRPNRQGVKRGPYKKKIAPKDAETNIRETCL